MAGALGMASERVAGRAAAGEGPVPGGDGARGGASWGPAPAAAPRVVGGDSPVTRLPLHAAAAHFLARPTSLQNGGRRHVRMVESKMGRGPGAAWTLQGT